jgi:hypothetical protein
VEMLVSLAVLTLALTAVGAVFAVTTKAVGQAAAYSEVQNWTRQFMDQLQEDLRYCEPSKSILVIAGRTQAAALTETDRQAQKYYRELLGDLKYVPAGYDPALNPNVDNRNGTNPPPQYSDPRADILMFFSNRATASQAPVVDPPPGSMAQVFANGVKATPIQVVYGHAALIQPVKTGSYPDRYAYPDVRIIDKRVDIEPHAGMNTLEEMSPLPANRWQLARRAVIIDSTPGAPPGVFRDSTDALRILCCQPDPVQGFGVAYLQGGDTARLDFKSMLEDFGPQPTTPPSGVATVFPYTDVLTSPVWPSGVGMFVQRLLYPARDTDGGHRLMAAVLEDVPAELRSNTNLRALPGCVWFQIEFLMPEDPRNSLEYTPPPPNTIPGNPNPSQRGEMMRWVSVDAGQTYLFVPDTEANRALVAAQVTTGSAVNFDANTRLATFARKDQNAANQLLKSDAIPQRIIRMWPYAIRVTVRAYDSRGRLDRPIVRSFVHRFD